MSRERKKSMHRGATQRKGVKTKEEIKKAVWGDGIRKGRRLKNVKQGREKQGYE